MNIYQKINSQKTAQTAHQLAFDHSQELLKQISQKLAEHKKVENPDWGNVGDLVHTIELLSDTLSFLKNEG